MSFYSLLVKLNKNLLLLLIKIKVDILQHKNIYSWLKSETIFRHTFINGGISNLTNYSSSQIIAFIYMYFILILSSDITIATFK